MISKRAYEAYCNAVDNLTRAAASTVESRILEWVAANPGASVAEARDAAVAVMDDLVRKYGEAAATLAADWYDALAALAGKRIPPAVADASGAGSKTEKVARYQAAKLESGDAAGFARSCGEYAAHESKLALNRTVMANAKRDRRKGVRFARVPTGATTCSFCLMLASRDAVYYSRKTAGEFDRWHTHCDCKVVPGFEDDPDAELVEGYKPRELRDLLRRFEEIDGLNLPAAQANAIKAAINDASGIETFREATSSQELADAFDDGIADALKRFRKNKTVASYESTVNVFLSQLGNVYGIELTGERFTNEKGKCVAANPNGEELWIAVKAGVSGQFLYATAEHKCPDMLTQQGILVEFKTPKSESKINKLLLDAASKYEKYAGESRNAVLSMLGLPGADGAALDAAERFVRDGTLDSVWVLDEHGALIKK